jgi:hypothetical protein
VAKQHSLTLTFRSTTSEHVFAVTNVYGPSDHRLSQPFLDEFCSLPPTLKVPWLAIGDFNLTRNPEDKNTSHFNFSLAESFNDSIQKSNLIELPLLDRSFTWSSGRESPTLTRIDRAFINILFNNSYPNTSLLTSHRALSVLGCSTQIFYPPSSLPGTPPWSLTMLLAHWLLEPKLQGPPQRPGRVSLAPLLISSKTATLWPCCLICSKSFDYYLQENVASVNGVRLPLRYSSTSGQQGGSSAANAVRSKKATPTHATSTHGPPSAADSAKFDRS